MSTGSLTLPGGPETSGTRYSYWLATRLILLLLASLLTVCTLGHFYGIVGLSLVWSIYVFYHPDDGLWVMPGLVMVAGFISPPDGFKWGAGYSPELVYWAIGFCFVLIAMLCRYFWPARQARAGEEKSAVMAPPRALYVLAAMSVVAAGVGLAHGYVLENVAKQLYGCALLCGYFLFALKFTPKLDDVERILNRLIIVGVIWSLVYLVIYLYQVPTLGLHKDLTVLSSYSGGLTVLLLPRLLTTNIRFKRGRTIAMALTLFAVPLLTMYKRGVAACCLCAYLAWALRSRSQRKRWLAVAAAFLAFTLAVSTSMLNPIGRWFSKYPSLDYLFPEDIQSNYSVFLRIEEMRQVIDSLGGVPILGTGLGSTITWYDPYTGIVWEQEYIDVGWGYLLVKMGIIGTAIFIWLVGSLVVDALRKPIDGVHLALFLLLIYHLVQMVADTLFVSFVTAAWAGTACGFLYIFNKGTAASPRGVTA